jgi:hypothetical protein
MQSHRDAADLPLCQSASSMCVVCWSANQCSSLQLMISRSAHTLAKPGHSNSAHLVTHVSVQVSVYDCSSTKTAAAAGWYPSQQWEESDRNGVKARAQHPHAPAETAPCAAHSAAKLKTHLTL